jgi:hypothetical protein
MKSKFLSVSLLVGACLLAAGRATAANARPLPQNPPAQPAAGTQPATAPQKAEKLAEWPALKSGDVERVVNAVAQLKKPETEAQEGGKRTLLEIGPAAAPMLFGQVTDQAQNANDRIYPVLDDLLGASHAALLARETKKPKVNLRRYLVLRLCRFGDAELLPVLAASQKDKDPETAFYAALGTLTLRQREGLAPVLTYAREHWKEVAPLLADQLPKVRSAEAGNWVAEAIAKAAVGEQITGLRLMRWLGTTDHHPILRTYLQSGDHSILKETVNALRVIHGEAAIDNLDVFRTIEMAKEWRTKV